MKDRQQYTKKDRTSVRVARCGHPSLQNRYFKCEVCEPTLPSDDGDFIFHQLERDAEDIDDEFPEDNCE